MRRLVVVAVAATLATLSFGGCAESNPCKFPLMVGKVLIFFDRDDGTQVTYHDQPATCQDGEPIPE